jgi:hypothetical protein
VGPESKTCRWGDAPAVVTAAVDAGDEGGLRWLDLCDRHVSQLQDARAKAPREDAMRRWLGEVGAWWRVYGEPPPYGPPVVHT